MSFLNTNTSLINTKLFFPNQSCFFSNLCVHNYRFTVNHQQETLYFITIPFQLLLSEVLSVTIKFLISSKIIYCMQKAYDNELSSMCWIFVLLVILPVQNPDLFLKQYFQIFYSNLMQLYYWQSRVVVVFIVVFILIWFSCPLVLQLCWFEAVIKYYLKLTGWLSFNWSYTNIIFNCFLVVPWPTLSHCWEDSITNPMLITAFSTILTWRSPGAL